MAQDEGWIDIRVAKAREAAPVEDGTAAALKKAMLERMLERQLPASELTQLAKALLSTMANDK